MISSINASKMMNTKINLFIHIVYHIFFILNEYFKDKKYPYKDITYCLKLFVRRTIYNVDNCDIHTFWSTESMCTIHRYCLADVTVKHDFKYILSSMLYLFLKIILFTYNSFSVFFFFKRLHHIYMYIGIIKSNILYKTK